MAFEPRRGDNLPFTVTVRLDGELYDLTGTTVTFSYNGIDSNKSGSLIADVSTNIEDTDIEKATATFNPEYTTFDVAGAYKFDIQVDNGSIRFTPSYGEFEVLKDVTV